MGPYAIPYGSTKRRLSIYKTAGAMGSATVLGMALPVARISCIASRTGVGNGKPRRGHTTQQHTHTNNTNAVRAPRDKTRRICEIAARCH